MALVPEELRRARALKASMTAAGRVHVSIHAQRLAQYGPAWKVVYRRMVNALRRCTAPTDIGFKYYGARGIRFGFPAAFDAAVWVLDNIGPPPEGKSIDRVDNSRGYEPGNLRWATVSEQNQNKRAYKRSASGDRVRVLKASRPDLTEQTIRTWIKQGFSDDKITDRRKHIGCGVRHTELRTPE